MKLGSAVESPCKHLDLGAFATLGMRSVLDNKGWSEDSKMHCLGILQATCIRHGA
jgi:hypothetical protein